MAKKSEKKTQDKELKTTKKSKKESIEVPKTELVRIVLKKDGKEYIVGYKLACELIDMSKATLA